jgi:hypothetical protein
MFNLINTINNIHLDYRITEVPYVELAEVEEYLISELTNETYDYSSYDGITQQLMYTTLKEYFKSLGITVHNNNTTDAILNSIYTVFTIDVTLTGEILSMLNTYGQ